MNPDSIHIARRIAVYMCERAESASRLPSPTKQWTCPHCGRVTTLVDIDVNHERDLAFFQGLGLALGVCFEEMLGKSVRDVRPVDLLKWAQELPSVPYPRVTPT